MKTFLQFLNESKKSSAPYGVLFLNDEKTAFVGVRHAHSSYVSNELKEKVNAIAKKYGKYWEGDGGDIKPLSKDWGDKDTYDEGWDDMFVKTFKKVEPYHLIVLFGNGNPEQFKNLTNPKLTIFDNLIKHPKLASYLGDMPFSEKILTTFLKTCSEPKKHIDLLAMSKVPATRKNVEKFIKTGMNLAFPPGKWLEYPNRASKLGKKLDIERNKFIMKKNGVFFAGAGHLDEIEKLAKQQNLSYKLYGGELSDT